jgi:hypothetical protein
VGIWRKESLVCDAAWLVLPTTRTDTIVHEDRQQDDRGKGSGER